MLNLSLNELKLFARSRGLKGMFKERLLSESESVESKNSFDDKRFEKILMSEDIDFKSLK